MFGNKRALMCCSVRRTPVLKFFLRPPEAPPSYSPRLLSMMVKLGDSLFRQNNLVSCTQSTAHSRSYVVVGERKAAHYTCKRQAIVSPEQADAAILLESPIIIEFSKPFDILTDAPNVVCFIRGENAAAVIWREMHLN